KLTSFTILPEKLYDVSKTLKGSTNPTVDGLPQIIIKKCIRSLATPLCHVMNISLRLGKVPFLWKRSNVSPTPKVPNASDCSQFRPISLTSSACKLMEKVVKIKLEDHIRRSGIMPIEQFGF